MTIKVMLADDQPLVRVGLRALIDAEPDMEVVGEAGDGEEALRVVKETRPDIVVMDIRMPGVDGLRPPAGSPPAPTCSRSGSSS